MSLHPRESALLIRLTHIGRATVPALPDATRRPTPPERLEIFAVGPDWVQLTWSALGPGVVDIRVGDHHHRVDADGGPGGLVIGDLAVGSRQRVEVTGTGIDRPITRAVTTLPRPPGEALTRFATISDVHLGSNSTGYLHTIVERPEPPVPNPVRCLQASVAELTRWGARRLVVKGDLVDASTPENWQAGAATFQDLDIPVDLLPGNHELNRRSSIDPPDGAALIGATWVEGVRTVDVDGIRLVLADSVRPGTDHGSVAAISDAIVDAAASTDRPVFVAMHHQIMRRRLPTYLPPGVPGPSGRRLLADLAAANPRSFVTSGHTHRHRRHDVAGIVATEVGSTKDFPGTWAGYEVFEGGIIQTVQRIIEPSVIRWTDHTRRAAGGLWSRWAPGSRDARCFTVPW